MFFSDVSSPKKKSFHQISAENLSRDQNYVTTFHPTSIFPFSGMSDGGRHGTSMENSQWKSSHPKDFYFLHFESGKFTCKIVSCVRLTRKKDSPFLSSSPCNKNLILDINFLQTIRDSLLVGIQNAAKCWPRTVPSRDVNLEFHTQRGNDVHTAKLFQTFPFFRTFSFFSRLAKISRLL